MKKLLVLMLVLSLVSAANAAISLSVNGEVAPPEITIAPSDIIVIDIQSDGTTSYPFWLYAYDGPGTLSNPRAAQGDLTELVRTLSYTGYTCYDIFVGDSAGGLVPGAGFLFDFHCDGPGDVLITLNDYNTYEVIDSLTIHQVDIPEPMTLSLLGLGGLFLRRRK